MTKIYYIFKKKKNRVERRYGSEFCAALCWARNLTLHRGFVVDTFQGQLRSSVTCKACGHTNRNYERYFCKEFGEKKCWCVRLISEGHIRSVLHAVYCSKIFAVEYSKCPCRPNVKTSRPTALKKKPRAQ